ncbi:3-isopropylmalate dehydrogenase [Candidatus Dojkabacteria bacterium]|nr:3-isopropylmalate dehydrogenase [Candidatus Dojkabacteria bacterium]
MKKKILVIEGDGIGKEVVPQAVKVLKKVAEKFGHEFEFDNALMGHCAIEATGEPLPEETIEKGRKFDAILFGAVGDPKYDNDPTLKVRPEQGLLKIRKTFELFANVRPIKLYDELLGASSLKPEVLSGSDIVFFRELVGGIYFGERARDDNKAHDTMEYSVSEVERIARKAFEAAMLRRKKVTSVDKANVLDCSRLWRETVTKVAEEYPEVELNHMYVDNAAMQLIKDPTQFDVVVTGNMFGDILTDEASQIAGSMGMLASASMGNEIALYEPIHGSAPDIAGQGIANPLAAILSAQMMLTLSFGMKDEADAIDNAVAQVLKDGYRGPDIKDAATPEELVVGTDAMGDLVVERV